MIQDQSMLIELNISSWTGRKQDKKIGEEVANQKQAVKDSARVSKDLLAGTTKLKEINNYAQNVRNWLYSRTLPWSDSGQRLLPTRSFFQFKQDLGVYEARYESMVADFLTEYDTLVNAAAFTLGDMFNRDEYPTADKIRGKFKFAYVFSPVPTSGDFRIMAAQDALVELKEQYEKAQQDRIEQAMRDAWGRLHESLTRISDRMTDEGVDKDGNPKAKVFHESTFLNALELTNLLSDFNITNDPKMEQARQDLERALSSLDITDLRKNADYRKEMKGSVDEILSKFDW